MNILQVNTHDLEGGAAFIARQLFQEIKNRGNTSALVVGWRVLDDPYIYEINPDEANNIWEQLWFKFSEIFGFFPEGTIRQFPEKICRAIARPDVTIRWLKGYEEYNYPRSRRILDMLPDAPDLIHCHNLHGGYFDLEYLPDLSRSIPLVLTLHDAWLLSGHCAHPLDCQRWEIGCSECPYLSIYPSVLVDNTAVNWKRKQDIFRRSRFYVSTPSKWLMEKIENSILESSIVEKKVIPCGTDLTVFKPGHKTIARDKLNLPSDKIILLFVAKYARINIWKDIETLRKSVELLSNNLSGKDVVLVILGDEGPTEFISNIEIRFCPFESDQVNVATYYHAADIYVHSARAETYPLAVIEALACGVPVIGTAVGGIPEQIRSLFSCSTIKTKAEDSESSTGILVKPGDTESLYQALYCLVQDKELRKRLGYNAVKYARENFDHIKHINSYLEWYEEILDRHKIEVISH